MTEQKNPAPAAQLVSVLPKVVKCDSCKKPIDPHNGNCRC